MITMAVQAANEVLDSTRTLRGIEARKILFRRPLFIPSGDMVVETAIHLRPIEDGSDDFSFRIFSQVEGDDWQENCSGLVSLHYLDGQQTAYKCDWGSHDSLYSTIRKRATRKLAPRTFYKFFDKKMNLQYGPLHQNVSECVAGVREGHGTITIPDTKAAMPSQFEYPHLIHPATLDSIFHMQALGYLHTLSGDESLVPVSIESVFIAADIPSKPGTLLHGYSKSVKTESGDFSGDIVFSDSDWLSPKAVILGFLSRNIAATNPSNAISTRQHRKCTAMQWEELGQNSGSGEETEKVQATDGHVAIMAKAPKVLILVSGPDTPPATQLLVDKLRNILKSLKGTVDVETFSHFLSDGNLSCTQDNLAETKVLQPLVERPPLMFEPDTSIISLIEVDQPFVARWTEADLTWFKNIASHTSAMLWVTRGGDYASEESLGFGITTGLLRTLRAEMPQLKLPHLDLSWKPDLAGDATIHAILTAIERSILSEDTIYEQEFAMREDKIFVPRLRLQESFHQELSSRPALTEPSLTRLADLDGAVEGIVDQTTKSIVWQYAEITECFGESDLEIVPSAVTLAHDQSENNHFLAIDALGTVSKVGSAVKGFAPGDSVVLCASHTLRTSIVIDESLARHIPAFVDPCLLVALPSALCTAQGALLDLGGLQSGETVLIVASSGSVEQALVSLATQIGAEVFVIAQNSKHEQLLVESLGIDEGHILKSSTLQGDSPFRKPKVNLVVTTLTGSPTQDPLGLLSDFGRFVSIGSRSAEVIAAPFRSNVVTANFDLERMRITSPAVVASLFKKSWDRSCKNGLPQAISTRSFPLPRHEAALEYLTGKRCFGSAILKLAPDHQVLVLPLRPVQLKLDPSATYILAGGLGGIGRSIADMMFDEAGARNIIFLSRSGATSEDAQHFLDSLSMRGCNAQAFECDITNPEQVQLFVAKCEGQGTKIKGILQCAMVLRDSMFENMTFQQ